MHMHTNISTITYIHITPPLPRHNLLLWRLYFKVVAEYKNVLCERKRACTLPVIRLYYYYYRTIFCIRLPVGQSPFWPKPKRLDNGWAGWNRYDRFPLADRLKFYGDSVYALMSRFREFYSSTNTIEYALKFGISTLRLIRYVFSVKFEKL